VYDTLVHLLRDPYAIIEDIHDPLSSKPISSAISPDIISFDREDEMIVQSGSNRGSIFGFLITLGAN